MLHKKVIVTGASYGIGASIVKALAAEGALVASMARSADLGEANAKELSAKGPGTVRFYRCDVSNRAQVKSAFAAAVKDMGGLDGLVHVAGVETKGYPEDETDENWDYQFNINAKGTFLANQAAFPYLKERGGRILNFGSGAGITPNMPEIAAYSASKAAVHTWTRAIAQAWGRYNITANIICPAVWSPMYEEHRSRYTAEELRVHDEQMARIVHIGGKLGDPDRDLTPMIIFLLGDGARFLTGQTYCIDGGATKVR
jgi:NAD(P)-dependent dehydrogenase (short-subunit alcohol dehydrogenase family)